jgi:hypothetical protein
MIRESPEAVRFVGAVLRHCDVDTALMAFDQSARGAGLAVDAESVELAERVVNSERHRRPRQGH